MSGKYAYTVGYQGVAVDAIADAARAAGVTMIVDTRRHPTSRRPEFRREALRLALAARGLRYESYPTLGVPRNIRPLAKSRPWLFQAAYRGVLGRAADAGDLATMIERIQDETVALLCFEAEPGQCHRSLLADALASRAPVTFIDLEVGRIEHAD